MICFWSHDIFSLSLVILFIYIPNVIPFPVSPPQISYSIPTPPASIRVLPYPLTHCSLTTLAFPYTGASSLQRTKSLPSHCLCVDCLSLLLLLFSLHYGRLSQQPALNPPMTYPVVLLASEASSDISTSRVYKSHIHSSFVLLSARIIGCIVTECLHELLWKDIKWLIWSLSNFTYLG